MQDCDNKNIKECQASVIRMQAQMEDLKEYVKELKNDANILREEVIKKGEELKDVFYVADMTRARIDEVDDYIKTGVDSLKDMVRKSKEDSIERDNRIEKIREDIISIKEKTPKIFVAAVKWVAIILTLLLLLFPRLHEFVNFLSGGK